MMFAYLPSIRRRGFWTVAAVLVAVLAWASFSANTRMQQRNASMSTHDVALIREVFHLQSQLGHKVWPGWTPQDAPFLYKTKYYDFLISHPNPPDDFVKAYDINYADTVWVRVNQDTTDVQAAFLLNDIQTAVITKPEEGNDACKWVLKAAHEVFHVYQHRRRPTRIVNPFVGKHADKHELSYPFPYDDNTINSVLRIEAEHIFQLITKDQVTTLDSIMAKKVFRHIQNVEQEVFKDSLDYVYKQWMEWCEGVARYTERRLAALAADTTLYQSTRRFAEFFSEWGYADTWASSYAQQLNPIRFVGEGVRGSTTIFYYSGMGKAYLLDRISPNWKSRYYGRTLDYLIIN